MGVVANKRLRAARAKQSRRIERLVAAHERRTPEAIAKRERIRSAARSAVAALKARAAAETRLVDALSRLLDAGLSIHEASERIGISHYEARHLLRPGSDSNQQ